MTLRLLPAFLGAALLLLPSLVQLWNSAAGVIGHKSWGVRISSLNGVRVETSRPELTLESVWTGQFEHLVSTRFGQQLSILPWAVRTKSWLYYHVLHASTVESIVVGRRRTLFEMIYLVEYCARDLAAFTPVADAWAQSLRDIQDYYEMRGRTFLYLITPSKVAVYPERLPALWPCAGRKRDKRDLLATYRRLLDEHGVHYVDAASRVAAAKSEFEIGVFPRSGTHWNAIGTAIGLQALFAALNQQDTRHHVDKFAFTWRPARPTGADNDLLNLLNVASSPRDVAPQVTLIPTSPNAICDPPNFTLVGGSFNWMLLNLISTLSCKPKIGFWYYFRTLYLDNLASVAPEPLTPKLVAQRDHELIDGDSDVVLEENEQAIPRSDHGKALYDLLQPRLSLRP